MRPLLRSRRKVKDNWPLGWLAGWINRLIGRESYPLNFGSRSGDSRLIVLLKDATMNGAMVSDLLSEEDDDDDDDNDKSLFR